MDITSSMCARITHPPGARRPRCNQRAVGSVLYEIQSSIGAGGMGEVYRARDTRLDRIVAIKVIAGCGRAGPVVPRAVRPRGASDLRARSSEHLHALRRRPRGRHRLPGDAVSRGGDAGRPAGAWRAPEVGRFWSGYECRDLVDANEGAAQHRPERCATAPRSPPRSTPRTAAASSIATSSPATSC